MPGRRTRKNSSKHRKPPLVFTESPYAQPRNVPSPVFASDHPPTAKVVPIDSDTEVTWVSPQFPKKAAVVPGKQRQSRRSRHLSAGLNSRSRNYSGNRSLLHNTRKKLPKGLVPLKFLGDETHEQDLSSVEDIQFDSELEEETSYRARRSVCNSSVVFVGPHKKKYTETPTSDRDIGSDNDNGAGNSVRRLSKRLFGKAKKDNETVTSYDELLSASMLNNPSIKQKTDKTVYDTDDSEDQCLVRRSKRIKERLMRDILKNSPLSQPQKTWKILVEDTPECECGLSVRERRLRYLNRTVNKRR